MFNVHFASSASFEQCLEVNDYKKFDTRNALSNCKSMEHFFFVFLKVLKNYFSESPYVLELIFKEKSVQN